MNDWVDEMLRAIKQQLDCEGSWWDEAMWTAVKMHFEHVFTDSVAIEKAIAALSALTLIENDIDGYIAKFESLPQKAGY